MKTKTDHANDKLKILFQVEALDRFDRSIIHAALPGVPYGTISGRLVDLQNAGLIEPHGHITRDVNEIRRVFGLDIDWNPVAASDAPTHVGAQKVKQYRKTRKWSWIGAYRVLFEGSA